jgi:L-ascorbate metabolism protein UlaG (beta-lactamase superfamily)
VIYIDPWLDNPKMPSELKAEGVPTDADLILITHGHFDHSASAPAILAASKKENAKIACIYEIGMFYENVSGVASSRLMTMNKSGTADLGYCKITMVSADHSSSCGMHQGNIFDGGAAAGWVIRLNSGVTVYHAGDTGIFGDMHLIDELYKPNYLLIPIGGNYTMGPEEAAYAAHHFFKHAHVVIPMHFGTFPLLPGTFE